MSPERIETLVLSGGGMKGVASLGAVSALRRAGALRHVKRVVGTSAGALVAAALAVDRVEREGAIRAAVAQGVSLRRTAAVVGCSDDTVRRVLGRG